jgi:menaquinone-dependent protoporphyrinogen oxidase
VIYTSNQSSANKVAWCVSELITDGDITLVDLKHQKTADLNRYKRIIIVGSVHSGKGVNEVEVFCALNEQLLLNKDLELYLSCTFNGEYAIKQFNESFSAILSKQNGSRAITGYEFYSNRRESGENVERNFTSGYSGYHSLIKRGQTNRMAGEMQN